MFSAQRILAYVLLAVVLVIGVLAAGQLHQEEGFLAEAPSEESARTGDTLTTVKADSIEDLMVKVKQAKRERKSTSIDEVLAKFENKEEKQQEKVATVKEKIEEDSIETQVVMPEPAPKPQPKAPGPMMQLDANSKEQGQFFVVTLSGLQSSPRLWFNSREYQAFALADGSYRALLPVENLTKPGSYSILARAEDWEQKIPVTIRDNNKAIQYITLDETKSGLQATQKELNNIGSSLRSMSLAQFWQGKFIYPSVAPKSSPFGVKRSYNKAPVSSYHKGLDFAGALGSAVVAPAAGTVVLVGQEVDGYVVHGNVVVIDHGHALTSIYMHLNTIAVQQGQQVTQGQQLGTIGHTGISTGPHLHWGTYLYGISFDPELIVSKAVN